tara:strand:- start:2954 stop:4075 length:1122 start_codon:yes stop_codon:yes gene_type:complete
MKVLHIISGLGNGGAEATLYQLCKHEQKNKHFVISLTEGGKYFNLLKEIEVNVFSLNLKKISTIYKLYRYIKDMKPDVVQTWMYHADLIGGVVAKIAGVKKICWGVHNSTLNYRQSKKTTLLILKMNTVLSFIVPDMIVYCAEKALNVHNKLGYNKEIGHVIPNGYDLSTFFIDGDKKKKFLTDLNFAGTLPLLGLVGRYDPFKDHGNLLNALGLLKAKGVGFRCILVGNCIDQANAELVNLITENNLNNNILLLGPRDDIPFVMNGIDIHILSSSAEAFPNVLCEAMACGTPCVSTLVGDAEIILGGTGWLCEPKTPFQLSQNILEAIEEYAGDIKGFNKRSLLARKHIVDNFSLNTMLQKYNESWESFISR